MRKLLIVAAGLVVLASPASAAPDRDTEANAAFVEYPKESLANGEQGAVHYKVKIDSRGRARDCEVTQSSGFRRLDLATCSMLLENGRFTPHRDGRGRVRSSSHEGRVVWQIS
jgi:protein TonB